MSSIDGVGIEELLFLRIRIAAEIRRREREGALRVRRSKGETLDKITTKKARSAARAALKIMDRRRLIVGPLPGLSGRVVEGLEGSLYPEMVRDPAPGETILKDGRNVQKLGGDVLVGHLRGARLFFLSLEERATCPRYCALWDACYTNSMPMLLRYRAGDALLAALRREVAELCRAHEKVLIRLHMSGDFYSVQYVEFWHHLLARHPGLHVFGFTAHDERSEIGRWVAGVREANPTRFAIRHSGRTGKWGSFTIPLMAEDRAMIGDAVVCPEQRDAMKGFPRFTHCGSCGLCWKTDDANHGRPIAFIEH